MPACVKQTCHGATQGFTLGEMAKPAVLTLSLFGGIIASYLFVFASALGQPASNGQHRPNLSGTWKLNLQRSGPILPRGTEALTVVIDTQESTIRLSETRTVSGKVTSGEGAAEPIDGQEHVSSPEPGKTAKQKKSWSGQTILMYWEMTDQQGTTYVSDIRISLSEGGKVLTMAEHYREPGMERIRDWVFEKQ